MKSNPAFDIIYDYTFLENSHSMYSVYIQYYFLTY